MNLTPWEVKVLATGNTTSLTFRFPNGIQMKDGLNWNRSDLATTVTATPSCSSYFRLSAAVRPAKFPPSTSTFLVDIRRSSPYDFIVGLARSRPGDCDLAFRSWNYWEVRTGRPVRSERVVALPGLDRDPAQLGELVDGGLAAEAAPPAALDPAERHLGLVVDGRAVDVADAGVDAPGHPDRTRHVPAEDGRGEPVLG